MDRLDSQGWIDFRFGTEQCAFFVRDGILWVRRGHKYSCTPVGGSDTISAARVLATIIVRETDNWWDEARAIELGLPRE